MPKKENVRVDIPEPDSPPPDSVRTGEETSTEVVSDVIKDERPADFEEVTTDDESETVVEIEEKVPPTAEELESMSMTEYLKWRDHPTESTFADEVRAERRAEKEAADEDRRKKIADLEGLSMEEYRKMVEKRDKDRARLPGSW